MAARSSRRRTDVAPPSTRSTPSAAERRNGPKTPTTAEVRRRRRTARSGGCAADLRKVADVGQHPDGQLRLADHEHPRQRQQQAARGERTEQGAPDGQAHRRIRRSTGSRPIRIISQYAATHRDAPTTRTTTPAGEA